MNKQQLLEYYYNDLSLPIKLPDGRVIQNRYIVKCYKAASTKLNEGVDRTLSFSSNEPSNLYLWSDIHFGHLIRALS